MEGGQTQNYKKTLKNTILTQGDDHRVDTYPTRVLPETTNRNTTLPSVHLVTLTNIK